MLDTGASLTFMEEKMLSRLGLCSDDLVPLKPGLQYTQETGAKPRDFARTQAKKCLQSMRV